jgi:hypothetical protein
MSATYEGTDFERSLRRQTDREYFRADSLGFGHTGQGRALVRHLLPQLAKLIAADRAKARNKVVWKALRATPDGVLAERLLIGRALAFSKPTLYYFSPTHHRSYMARGQCPLCAKSGLSAAPFRQPS